MLGWNSPWLPRCLSQLEHRPSARTVDADVTCETGRVLHCRRYLSVSFPPEVAASRLMAAA